MKVVFRQHDTEPAVLGDIDAHRRKRVQERSGRNGAEAREADGGFPQTALGHPGVDPQRLPEGDAPGHGLGGLSDVTLCL